MLYERGSRAMVSLPTGAGKTRVAVETLATWLLERWDHQLEQADRGVVIWLGYEAFRAVWYPERGD